MNSSRCHLQSSQRGAGGWELRGFLPEEPQGLVYSALSELISLESSICPQEAQQAEPCLGDTGCTRGMKGSGF